MIDELSLCKWLSRFTAKDVVRQLDLYSVSLLLRAVVRFTSFQSTQSTKCNNSDNNVIVNTIDSSDKNLTSLSNETITNKSISKTSNV